ncbi:MAG TPA: FtsX-like permease family protein, partial [Gemmatimonadaceae bacterium]|nr:FtsX-like permease family protein [Gemmatimonadaceae bacterium]
GSYQVIVNERFARKQWQGGSPLGKRLRVSQKGDEPWLTIVGVAADAATGGPMMMESTAPLLYTPAADSDAHAVLIRANAPAPLLATARSVLHGIDPALSPKLESATTIVRDSIATPKFVMTLLTVFTVLALLLAAVGLYGVMAYTVAQRTREIGIRVALGATRSRIARGVVTGGIALAIVGCGLGGAISLWGSKLIEHQLYGVAAHDAASFAAAVVVLLLAAGMACVVPVRRALAVDPMTAIRAD